MLVLIHGFSGGPASWDALMPLLPTETEVLRPTLLGHGSGWRESSVETFVDEVERIAETLARTAGPHQLCGYSLGGRVALGLLASHPRLFNSAVVIASHPGLKTPGKREERIKVDRGRAEQLRTEGMAAFVDSWESLPLFETQHRLLDDVLERQRKVRLAHDPEGVARSLDVLGLGKMPDLRPSLSAVDLPVTLLVGELDYNYRLLAEEMSSELPDARVLTVAGVGHNVVLEAPEAVAEALRRANRSTPAVAS